jgi:hypothetical protein
MKADHRMRADSWRTPAPHGASSFSAQPRPSTPTDSQSQATPKAHPPTQGQTRQPNRSATSRARGLSGARLPELQLQVVDAGCRPHGLRRVRASSTTSRTKNVPPGTAAAPPGRPSALSPNGARREHGKWQEEEAAPRNVRPRPRGLQQTQPAPRARRPASIPGRHPERLPLTRSALRLHVTDGRCQPRLPPDVTECAPQSHSACRTDPKLILAPRTHPISPVRQVPIRLFALPRYSQPFLFASGRRDAFSFL